MNKVEAARRVIVDLIAEMRLADLDYGSRAMVAARDYLRATGDVDHVTPLRALAYGMQKGDTRAKVERAADYIEKLEMEKLLRE
jgi:hypothetical protein